MLSDMGRMSGVLVNLTLMAHFYPCGATYQHCYSEEPMIRMMRKGINDLSSLKLEYWDNSCPFMKGQYPVGVNIPTENEIKLLSTPSEEEKTIVEMAMSSDKFN